MEESRSGENREISGTKLFSSASNEFPASIGYQAIFVALQCKNYEEKYLKTVHPLALGVDLIGAENEIEILVNSANLIHKKNRVNEPIDKDKMVGIVNSVFKLAEELMVLDKDVLERLADKKEHGKHLLQARSQHPGEVENDFTSKLQKMVREKGGKGILVFYDPDSY